MTNYNVEQKLREHDSMLKLHETRFESLDSSMLTHYQDMQKYLNSQITDIVKDNINDVTDNLVKLADNLKEEIQNTKEEIDDFKQDITNIIDENKQDIANMIKQSETEIKTNMDKFQQDSIQIQEETINKIKLELTDALIKIEDSSNDWKDYIQNHTNDLNNKIDIIEQKMSEFDGNISDIIQQMEGNITNVTSGIEKILQDNIDKVNESIAESQSKVNKELNEMKLSVLNLENTIIEKIFPIGSLYTTADPNLMDPNTVLGTSFTWKILQDGCKLMSSSSNIGDIGGTNNINIGHSHRIDFLYGTYYGEICLEGINHTIGFPGSYDSNNNPRDYSGDNGNQGGASVAYNYSTSRSTQSTMMQVHKSSGVTGHMSNNSLIDITGKHLKVKIFERTA